MTTRTQILATAAALFLAASSAIAAGKGADLYTKHNCHTCHGANGNAPIMPIYPKLGGQSADYSIAQIKDIKSGKRSNGQAAAMKALVAAVPDADLKEISTWLATVK